LSERTERAPTIAKTKKKVINLTLTELKANACQKPTLRLWKVGLPWWSSAEIFVLPMQGPSSVPGQGTRSHMLQPRVHLPKPSKQTIKDKP